MYVGTLCVRTKVKGWFVSLSLECEDFAFEEDIGLSDLEMLIKHLENVVEQVRENEDRTFGVPE